MEPDAGAAPSPGVTDQAAVLTAERERVAELTTIKGQFPNSAATVDRAIAEATSVEDARAAVMKELADAHGKAPPLTPPSPESIAKQVHDRAEDKPWTHFGEQLKAVAFAARQGVQADPRLFRAAATGLGENVPADGGFAVEKEFSLSLTEKLFTSGAVLSRVARTPIGAGRNGLKRVLINETSRADGSRAGGVRGYWRDEGIAPTASAPKTRLMEQTLHTVGAIVYATDELLEDSTAMEALVRREVPDELGFKVEDAIIEGDGAGKPLGIMSSPALKTVTVEVGQVAGDLEAANFAKMYAAMPPRSVAGSAWFINANVLPELLTAGITFGTGGQSLFMPAGFNGQPFNTILGQPVVPIEYAASFNTVGDILFADLQRYELIEKGGVRDASSIHVRFLQSEMVFRFTWRVDGQTIENSAVTPFKGTDTISPFVVLGTRS